MFVDIHKMSPKCQHVFLLSDNQLTQSINYGPTDENFDWHLDFDMRKVLAKFVDLSVVLSENIWWKKSIKNVFDQMSNMYLSKNLPKSISYNC